VSTPQGTLKWNGSDWIDDGTFGCPATGCQPHYSGNRNAPGAEPIEWTLALNGHRAGIVSNEAFKADRTAILLALSTGKPYVPSTPFVEIDGRRMGSEEFVEHNRRQFAAGKDVSLVVDAETRELAELERASGGQLSTVVDGIQSELWPNFARELFARLYGDPKPTGSPPGPETLSGTLHAALSESEEWGQLQEMSRGDEWAAGIGSAKLGQRLIERFGDQLRELPKQDPAKLATDADTLAEMLRGDTSEEANRITSAARQRWNDATQAEKEVASIIESNWDETTETIRSAAQEVSVELARVEAAMVGLGHGNGGGSFSKVAGPKDELLRRMRSDPKLRRVAEMAGRLKIAARKAQRSKTKYIPEQISGVTIGGELSRLLPSELALLADDDTEILAIKRVIEREALEYAVSGHESLDRGPLVFCVDESGSMRGSRHEMAMALAVALIEVCAMQKRAFALVHFDSCVRRTWVCRKPATLHPETLFAEIGYFSGGGTDFEPPLVESARLIRDGQIGLKEADVMLLTDGAAGWVQRGAMTELSELGARVWGISIGGCFTEPQKAQLAGLAALPESLEGLADGLSVVLGV
jgi:uncharacterized protein with von Willebrand factor type A (vWA) domain